MRPYRGIPVGGGEFVYGCLTQHYTPSSRYLTIGPEIEWFEEDCLHSVEVIPESVGQSTGLLDKEGVEIWQDSIFRRDDGKVGRVVWFNAMWVVGYGKEGIVELHFDAGLGEVIGDIHTTPEKLEKTE